MRVDRCLEGPVRSATEPIDDSCVREIQTGNEGVVDQTGASRNQLRSWLGKIQQLRSAA
jgi:hypothetical protein